MTDRDYEIEISTLRAELATVRAERDALKNNEWLLVELFRSPAFITEGQIGDDLNLSPCQSAVKTMQDLHTTLKSVKADRDDWRDIAIGLRDFGGPPLPKHQRQFGEVLARYLERLRKEGA